MASVPGRFSYELELPPLPNSNEPYQVVGQDSSLSFEELASVVAGRLRQDDIGT